MKWRYRDTVLALCTLAFFATMIARLGISPVVPEITDDFDISNTAIGVALSGMWMAYFLAQFPSGVLADRVGERLVILLAVGGTGFATVSIAFSMYFPLFVLSTVALGLLAGLHYSVATALLSRIYDDIGVAIGIHSAGGPAAGLIAPILVAVIAVRFGWRIALLTVAILTIPVFLLFAWRVRPTPPRRPDEPIRERMRMSVIAGLLSRPTIAFTVCIAIAAAFVWQAIASFLPTFLIEERGLTASAAGGLFAGYFVVQGVTQVGVGAVSDRYGRDVATGGCMLVAIAGLVALIVGPGWASLLTGVALLGTGLGWGAALLPRFMDALSEAERGMGFGLVRTVYGVIGALGSVGTGLFADHIGWPAAFTVLIGLLGFVVIALAANRLFRLGY